MLNHNVNESFAEQTYNKALKERLARGQIVQISVAGASKATARSIEPGAFLATPTSRPRIGVVVQSSNENEPSVAVKVAGEVTVLLADAVDYSSVAANTVYSLNVLASGLGASTGGILARKASGSVNFIAADVYKDQGKQYVRVSL